MSESAGPTSHRRPQSHLPVATLLGAAMTATVLAAAPVLADAPTSAATTRTTPLAVPIGGDATPVHPVVRNALEAADAVSGMVPWTAAGGVVGVSQVVPGSPSTSAETRLFGMAVPASTSTPAADTDTVEVGHLRLHRPRAVSPALAAEVTATSGEVVQGISDVLQSNGVGPERADTVAEHMVGDAAVGAVVGGVVAAPVAATVGAVVGGTVGLVFGIPFLPTGLVVGPLVGTALVASLVEIPAVTTGAIVGAATGYQRGWEVPLDTPTSTPRHDVSGQVVVTTPAPSAAASAQPVSHPSVPLPLSLPALR
ncbi:hypothetical protein ABLE92_16990 [Gordonia sp. VNQ95]|uniref:hypothetical protein n=1 Tax=Gordonia sp. VNQ95 TaxID=3156619 RepID=UPI0032B53E7F